MEGAISDLRPSRAQKSWCHGWRHPLWLECGRRTRAPGGQHEAIGGRGTKDRGRGGRGGTSTAWNSLVRLPAEGRGGAALPPSFQGQEERVGDHNVKHDDDDVLQHLRSRCRVRVYPHLVVRLRTWDDYAAPRDVDGRVGVTPPGRAGGWGCYRQWLGGHTTKIAGWVVAYLEGTDGRMRGAGTYLDGHRWKGEE